MDELIKALNILNKYITDPYLRDYPTACEHDILFVFAKPANVSEEDKKELAKLDFYPYEDTGECFYSTKFGSN